MNLSSKFIWTIVEIIYSIYGLEFVDYKERVKRFHILKKMYSIIILILLTVVAFGMIIELIDVMEKNKIKFLFNVIIIEENLISIVSIMTEISLKFPKIDYIHQNIISIDEHLKLDKDLNLKFKLKMTICFTVYILFEIVSFSSYVFFSTLDIITIMVLVRSILFDLTVFKFLMMMHLHLCRLHFMNDCLKKRLNSKRDNRKINWLHKWKLSPEHLESDHSIENINVFLVVYSNLCENVVLISKKYTIFVSKKLINN